MFIAIRSRSTAVIRPLTLILSFGYLAFEVYLLAARRGHGRMTSDDRGTLAKIWALILGSCLFGPFAVLCG